MPKQKTRKSLLKRFKISSRGKLLHRSSFLRHLRSNKSKKRLRSQKKLKGVEKALAIKIRKILGVKLR